MIEIGKIYYWRSQSRGNVIPLYSGIAMAKGNDGNVILKDLNDEVWTVPEDYLMEAPNR